MLAEHIAPINNVNRVVLCHLSKKYFSCWCDEGTRGRAAGQHLRGLVKNKGWRQKAERAREKSCVNACPSPIVMARRIVSTADLSGAGEELQFAALRRMRAECRRMPMAAYLPASKSKRHALRARQALIDIAAAVSISMRV